MSVRILTGDCRESMAAMHADSIASCVTDPPYHLTSIVKRFGAENAAPAKVGATGAYARASKGFMGQTWDGGDVAFQPETWAAVLRVLKPGAHLVAFSGTRTYHRMVCAIEDAGFEIRDQLAWCYSTGFPKSHDVSKGIAGLWMPITSAPKDGTKIRVRYPDDSTEDGVYYAEDRCCVLGARAGSYGEGWVSTEAGNLPVGDDPVEWQTLDGRGLGWGTALKPAWEPICLARKPLIGSVAKNVLAHGTGALNIDGCRIEAKGRPARVVAPLREGVNYGGNALEGRVDGSLQSSKAVGTTDLGRWPANIIHDGSDEVLAAFPDAPGQMATVTGNEPSVPGYSGGYGRSPAALPRNDSGSAARFFYCAKATTEERGEGNNHPTVKPQALMRWLCRLVTPVGGTVLDPFAGSGSTLIAADAEQFSAIGCELSPDYAAIAERRVRDAAGLFAEVRAA